MSTDYFSPKRAAPAYELTPLASYQLAQSRAGEVIATLPPVVTTIIGLSALKGPTSHAHEPIERVIWPRKASPPLDDQGLSIRQSADIAAGPIPPEWWVDALLRIGELLTLNAGWDTYDAQAIDRDTAEAALVFVWDRGRSVGAAPWIVPTPRGGLQFEWHTNDIDVELEFIPGSEPVLCVEDAHGEFEGPLREQNELWARVLERL